MKFLESAGLVILVLVFGGWAVNIYKFTQLDFEPSYKAEIIRGVGVIPPIGAVLAWVEFDEESEL